MKVLREYFGYFRDLGVIWSCWIFWGHFKHFLGFGDIFSHFGGYQVFLYHFGGLRVLWSFWSFGSILLFWRYWGVFRVFQSLWSFQGFLGHFGSFKRYFDYFRDLRVFVILSFWAFQPFPWFWGYSSYFSRLGISWSSLRFWGCFGHFKMWLRISKIHKGWMLCQIWGFWVSESLMYSA